ncbi:MAG: lipid-binding SYLF domain-containing protein [Planctomycetota bacterium]|jgi:lipid-binding SYLF domain-containing protein|nr:lipid-binding SYLF domain-containing protein [Planctomycetota bacterium]
MLKISPRFALTCAAVVAAFCVCHTLGPTYAASRRATRENVVNRLADFQAFFLDFQYAPDSAVPNELLAQCHGIIIMRQYKAGFVFGVKGGDGVILLHNPDTGSWSAPAFIATAEGSFGFQIGGQAIDAIILIMNRDGVNMLLKSRFQVGVDASAAAGPVGRDAAAKVGPGTALLTYSRAKGLYAGAAFEGGAFLNYDAFNHAIYGMQVGLKDILIDQIVGFPPEALPLVQTLQAYSNSTRYPDNVSAPHPGSMPLVPTYTLPPPAAVYSEPIPYVEPLNPIDAGPIMDLPPSTIEPPPVPPSTPTANAEAAAEAVRAASVK